MKTWAFFSGLFWKTLLWGLVVSVTIKILINAMIEPIPPNPRLSSLEGRIFPFPPGRLAITHAEHWSNGWPDYTDGIIGKVSSMLGSFIERFVEYDNVELIVWSSICGWVILSLFGGTISESPKEDLKLHYIGAGLFLAGAISNQGEVAMLGHATDWLFLRVSESSRTFVVANCADIMVAVGFVSLTFLAPFYKRLKQQIRQDQVSASSEEH